MIPARVVAVRNLKSVADNRLPNTGSDTEKTTSG